MGTPGPLLRPLTRFVGRSREVPLIRRLLDEHRLVCITGVGGCGKTRLAVYAVDGMSPAFAMVAFADLSTCDDAVSVDAAVVAAVGGRPMPDADPVAVVRGLVGDSHAILVVDNCEHVVDAAARTLECVLEACPGLVVLATSREPLGIAGEVVARIPPLTVPDAADEVPTVFGSEAVELFVDRAMLADPTFDVTDNLDAIAEICRGVDGLPLAIELAAARISVMAVTDIAAGLSRRFRLLSGGPRGASRRHRSMRACIEWSTGLLSDAERRVLHRLAIFPGSWRLSTAQRVVGDDELGPDDVGDIVLGLVRRSLVARDGDAPDRYRLLESIRDHAADELQRSGDRGELASRLLEEVRGRCHHAEELLERGDLGATVAALRADHDQLVVAFDRAVDVDPEATWELYSSLAFYWTSSGRFDQAARWFAECQSHPAPSTSVEARAAWAAAYVDTYSGRFEDAIGHAERAVALASEAGDASTVARATEVLGLAALYTDPAASERLLREAVATAERAGDRWCSADAAQILGFLLLFDGRLSDAATWVGRARETALDLQNPQLLAWDAAATALLAVGRGHDDEVVASLEAAASHAAVTGDPNIVGTVVAVRTMYETQVGNAAPWVALVTSELERCTQLGAGQAVLSLAGAAMDAVTAAGRPDDAEQIWAVCRDATVEFAPAALPRLALGAAGAALARDSRRDAAERLELGRRVAKSLNRHNDAAATESWLAALALSAGNARAAIRLAVTASATLEDCELAAYQYDLGVVWAAILSSTGHADAPTVAQLVEAGRPTVRRHEIESLLGECLVRSTDIATNETIDDVVTPLAEAIRVAMRGRRPRRAGRVGWESLTPAERTVVELAIDGLTNGSIARRLHVSAGTVKTHLAHVYTKLGVANRTELANVALRSRERLAHRSPD